MNQKPLGILLGVLLFSSAIKAQEFSTRHSILDEQLRLINQNEARLNQTFRKETLKPAIELTKEEEKNSSKEIKNQGVKIKLKTVSLSGSSFFKKKFKNLIKSYEEKEFTVEEIQDLKEKMQTECIKEGYLTTYIELPTQNLKEGNLVLKVTEGKIETINWENVAIQKYLILPNLEGKILNIKDIEKGLNLANHLNGQYLEVEIIPSETKVGQSQLNISRKIKNTGTANLVYNTLTDKTLTVVPSSIEVTQENIVNSWDQWRLSYYQYQKEQHNFQNSMSLSLAVPVRIGIFKVAYSQFDQSQLQGTYTKKPWTTHRETQSYELKVPLKHTKTEKIEMEFQIDSTQNLQKIGDIIIDETQYTRSIGSIGISQLKFYKKGFLYTKLNWQRSLPFLKEKQGVKSELFRFQKYILSINGNVNLYKKINWESEWVGQYTNEALQSSDQMMIGSYYTVRGIETPQIAEKGVYVRNECRYEGPNLGELKTELGALVDIGQLWRLSDAGGSRKEESIASYGILMSLESKKGNLDITVATPMWSSKIPKKTLGKGRLDIVFRMSLY